MTLRELRGIIGKTPDGRMPKPTEIKKGEIVARKKTDSSELTVYRSGYAIYSAEGRETVIRADTCRNYTYVFTDGTEQLSEEYFIDRDFSLLLTLAAEDRLGNNIRRKNRYYVHCHGRIYEDEGTDPEKRYLGNEWVEEVYASLTDKQKAVFRLCFCDGLSTRQAGNELGCSNVAVQKTRDAIVNKAKTILEQG